MPDSDTPRTVHRRAPAKLNLALAVDRARDEDDEFDGFHPIASWMAPIDLVDELLVTRLEDDRLSRYAILWHEEAVRTSPIDWSIRDDLAVRAHFAMQEYAGRELPVQLKLEKRIPVGGGLGGGSSNAAAMLLALRELFAIEITDKRLDEIALALGSDVPFFLRAGSSFVENLGEQISPAPSPSGWAVLAMPAFGCPTGAVYRAFDDDPPETFRADEVRAMASGTADLGSVLFNDLAAPAMAVEPRLAELHRALNGIGGSAFHVTGSGSTLFALSTDEDSARELRERASGVDDDLAVLAVPFEGA